MTTPTEETVRSEIRAWLAANWDPNQSLIEWRERLVNSGWGAPSWPNDLYGRGLEPGLASVVDDEMRRAGAVGVARSGARSLAIQTLLAHGSESQKREFLPPSLTGQYNWCQLFSEPGSGSDLAGASTRADLKDGRWIINGQKVWTTSAHLADWGLLLARTDWDAPKHAGLSFFLINMRQPGIEVRPLRQMNGYASFNEVFLTDAEVAPENLVGDLGGGWAVANTTLMHERSHGDPSAAKATNAGGRQGRVYDEEREEIAIATEPYGWYPQRAGRVDLILERARETGKINDPVVRQEIAKLLILDRSAKWTALRARADLAAGAGLGPAGSLMKLVGSHVARSGARVHTLISGADSMLAGADAPRDGLIAEVLISVPAVSIAGGTDEIQRNIIAERMLRMPKDPSADTHRPFRDVPKNPVQAAR
jgi:alkylation response protein AidB-like acyl-CoA dehydrogenase